VVEEREWWRRSMERRGEREELERKGSGVGRGRLLGVSRRGEEG